MVNDCHSLPYCYNYNTVMSWYHDCTIAIFAFCVYKENTLPFTEHHTIPKQKSWKPCKISTCLQFLPITNLYYDLRFADVAYIVRKYYCFNMSSSFRFPLIMNTWMIKHIIYTFYTPDPIVIPVYFLNCCELNTCSPVSFILI